MRFFALHHLSIILLLFFTFSFLYSSDHSFNQDLGRHLKLGEIIWKTFQVPQTNLFSYTFPDFPFVNHHWLFQVLVYLASISIGTQGMLVIKILILLAGVCIILILAKKNNSIFFIPVSFLFLHMLRGRIELRPEIFSFLFTAVILFILDRYEKSETRLIYVLPIVSILWVNMHIYYPVGIFLQIIYVAHFAIQKFIYKQKGPKSGKKLKTMLSITCLSIVLSLLNPNFFKGATYAFTVFHNYGVTITENQNMATLQSTGFVNPDFLFAYFCFLIIALAFIVGLIRHKVTFKNAALLTLGVILSVQSIRGFPYVLFLCLPVVLLYIDYKKSNFWVKSLNGVIVLLVFIEAFYYLSGDYYKLTYRNHTPSLMAVEDANLAVDFVLAHKLPQPIFNNFDIGSYLIYRMYPSYKVYIDGRPEAYPAKFFEERYIPMQEDYSKFKQESKKVGFNTIIFSIMDQNPRTINFLRTLIIDKEWKMVYLDYYMVVFVRTAIADDLKLTVLDLDTINVDSYNYSDVVAYTNLSTFLFNMHKFEKAKAINKKALVLMPDNPAANKVMANILLQDKKPNSRLIYEYLSKSENGIFW